MFRKAIVGDFVEAKLVSYRLSSTYYKDESQAIKVYGNRFIKLLDRDEDYLSDEEIKFAEESF